MTTSSQTTTRSASLESIAIATRMIERAEAQSAQTRSLTPARVFERVVLVGLDLLMVNLAFYLAWYARYRLGLFVALDPGNYVEHDVYLPLQIALSLAFAFLIALRGLYRLPRAASAVDDLSTLFTVAGISVMLLFAGSTFVRYPAESRLTLIFAWALITLLTFLGRANWLWVLGVLHGRGVAVERTLVVGDNTVGRMIMQALAGRPHLGYAVAGFLSTDGNSDFGRFRRLGTPDELDRVIHQERIAQVVIALPSASHEAIMRIVNHCRRDGVQFRLVPDLYEVSLGRLDMDTVSGIPLMGIKNPAIQGVNFFAKRVIDVVISLALLLLFAWFLVPLGLLIWLGDRRCSPLFGQERVGRGGRQFTMQKFRSMRPDADKQLADLLAYNEAEGPIFKMRDDPRRTRIGAFIRRWSLDELPQLWNVLKGDMSLVGPRPATAREVALYEEWQLHRLDALPGITGLWQVSGRSELGFSEQVLMDITYIENWSLGLDLRILLRTVPAVLTGKGAF
ncbi:MAG: sugar transferase [Chloroflexi bacterium]|nr:sugar transferase [Chloroflexota bacterium]MBV9601070.1 sugar transferase [Chloroflexota bacterium]